MRTLFPRCSQQVSFSGFASAHQIPEGFVRRVRDVAVPATLALGRNITKVPKFISSSRRL